MLRIAIVALLAGWSGVVSAAEPLRKTLTSTKANVHVRQWQAAARQVTPKCPVAWSVRKYTLHGGKQEGVDVIVVDNGKLRFTVVPTRGMGVLSVTMGDVRLGWDSPVKEVVHPKWINLQSRGGLGWLEGFNECLCRCGLESNGHPGTDKFINNVGDEATMDLTLHGRIANLPAQEVEVVIDREAPYRIRVRGRVDERMFYGPKLELQTEISTEPGATTFRIADIITNRGAGAQEFQLLYHANYGKPLLEAGASFVAPVRRVTPFNDHAAKGLASYRVYSGPKLGFIEQVYCLRLQGDKRDRTVVMLQNKAQDRAVSMAFSLRELPYFTLWKNTAAVEDGYVTGLEPGTNFPYNRRIERPLGRVPKLAAGARYRTAIDFAIHAGKDEVKQVAGRIAALQADVRPVVDPQPVKPDSWTRTNRLHQKEVARANTAVARARARAAKDPTRPAYHFQAPALWMNDPNGPIYYQGAYHLFYQHNPYGEDWGHMHWGHARSKDLVHWEHLPIALAPSSDRGEEHCFSGCCVVNDGVPTILYTSIGPRTPAADGAVQWLATSRDGLLTWDKHPANPILTSALHDNLVIKDWRDPFVWKEGGTWFMVLGGHRDGGHGCVAIYRSTNLIDWKFLNILYEGKDKNWECPNFFKLGDRWVLIYSPHGPVKYATGTLTKDYRFQPSVHGTIDQSATYYAPSSLADARGRRLLWGWVRVKGDGWNGMLSLPRVLTLRPDGRLGMAPAPELKALRGKHHRWEDFTLKPTSANPLKDIRGDCLEILAEFEPGDARSFGLGLRRSPDGKDETPIRFDRGRKELQAGSARGPFEFLKGEKTLKLHIFLDRSVLEVYANGHECFTSPVAAKGKDRLGLALFAKGGNVKVKSLDIWQMKSSQPPK
jgi:beta-fructofuranosidase